MTPDLLFRLYVGGRLVEERRLGPDDDVRAAAELAGDLTRAGIEGGLRYLLVVTDPDLPDDESVVYCIGDDDDLFPYWRERAHPAAHIGTTTLDDEARRSAEEDPPGR